MPPKKLRHFGTISSGPNRSSCKKWCANCSFAGPVKHRSSNSKCNQRQCRDQECYKWVRAKRSKKIPARPRGDPYVHEGVHPVKCNARFWNRQPHLWMPQLCIARNFLFRRGGDASQKTPPLWYDLFRSKPSSCKKWCANCSFAGPVKHRSSNSKCNQRQCRDQECCKWVRAKRSKKIPARPRGEPIRA